MKRLFAILLFSLAMLFAGCVSVDRTLSDAQHSLSVSRDKLDAFVLHDYKNQMAGPQHNLAEQVRREAPAKFRAAIQAMGDYKRLHDGDSKKRLEAATDYLTDLTTKAAAFTN